MTHIAKQLENLRIQLQHVTTNNKDDINYEDQISYIENQIKNLELEEYYSTLEDIVEIDSTIEKIYQYKGPIYKFDKYIGESQLIETKAKSFKKAKSNITYRLKMLLNFPSNNNLSIDEKRIKEVI